MLLQIQRCAAAAASIYFLLAPALAHATPVKIPEGTEMLIRFNDALSSGKNSEGDQFSITLDEDVKLPDGTVLKRGY